MDNRGIPITEEDYITILKQGGRVEKIYGTCNENDFLQDIKPYIENIKIAKGVLLELILPKTIEKSYAFIFNYFSEVINYIQESSLIVYGYDFDDLEENSISYKLLMSGITFKLKKNDEKNQIITEKDKEELRAFNQRLIKVQENISKEAIKLDKQLKLRVDDENDSMIDYEIDLELSFYLKDDDPEYRDDDDCIISTITYGLKDISSEKENFEDILDTSINHYDYFKKDDLADISKSWLFFKLMYHNKVSWQDMLRIGTIWTDINVKYQYWDKYNLKNL